MHDDTLSAEAVSQYLLDNPDFFIQRQALLDKLSIAHQQQGSVSLVEIQMGRQRQKIQQLEEEITSLMSLAAKNDRIFQQLIEVQQQLLECSSYQQLKACLKAYAHSLRLNAHLLLLQPLHGSGTLNREVFNRFQTNHLNGKPAYLGRLNRQDRRDLFGETPFSHQLSELGSYVILPLDNHNHLGLLAFSSQDGGHFQPEMDTLFLQHLAALVAYLVVNLAQNELQMVSRLSCANE